MGEVVKKRGTAWWVGLMLGAVVIGMIFEHSRAPQSPYQLQAVADLPAPARKAITAPSATKDIVVRLSIKPAQRQRFVDAIRGVIEQSRKADGCLVFDVYQQRDDANAFVVYERWANAQAHQQHLATPYTAAFLAQLSGMLNEAPKELELHDLIID
jgi:quinol monooxygenase YgiN